MEMASADAELRAALFRFVDVAPACRSLDDLARHLAGVLDEVRLRSALTQLASGVMALHGNHIIHRDLKPSNVMVARGGHLMLLDFGLVAELDALGVPLSINNGAGTPRYMAPEQAASRPVTTASDWYAVGVMLYEALAGKPRAHA